MPKMGPIDYELDQVKLMRNLTIRVRLIRTREMRVRLWIAVQLIRLATWVTGMGLEIEHEEADDV